jgi:putative ABC transport system permease protein
LARPLDDSLEPLAIPEQGVVISEAMAGWLGVSRGDRIRLRLYERGRTKVELPVSAVAKSYVGLTFLTLYMDRRLLNRILREDDVITGAQLRVDETRTDELYAAIQATPSITGAVSQGAALKTMRRIVSENLRIALINIVVAAIIIFGVVYNSARISLSERVRELASMRMLGYSRFDAAYVLAGELWLLGLLALPIGFALGYGVAFMMTEGTASEMFRLPLHLEPRAFGYAALVVVVTLAVSTLAVARQLFSVDIVSVLKARD